MFKPSIIKLVFVTLCVVAIVIALASCRDSTATPSRDYAAAQQVRAVSLHVAADEASVNAAGKREAAKIAQEQAKAEPTEARIAKAAAALAEARIATAIAEDRQAVAAHADQAVVDANTKADKEAKDKADADNARKWRTIAAAIGGACVLAGVVGGAIVWYLVGKWLAVRVAAVGIVAGVAIPVYAATVRWLPWIGLVALAIGMCDWWLTQRQQRVK